MMRGHYIIVYSKTVNTCLGLYVEPEQELLVFCQCTESHQLYKANLLRSKMVVTSWIVVLIYNHGFALPVLYC